MTKSKWTLPYLITVANLFCGFIAVAYGLNDKIVAASWLIIAAGFLDGLDGKIARFTGASTRFGVEFDSMADLISFGVAPAVLLFTYQFHRLGFLGWIFIFVYVATGAFRLARFNFQFQGVRKNFFKGMPITMAGMTAAAFIIFANSFQTTVGNTVTTSCLTLLLSVLMISTIRYEGLPGFPLETRKDKAKAIALFLSAVFIAIKPAAAFFPLMMGYLCLGLLEWAYGVVLKAATFTSHNKQKRYM